MWTLATAVQMQDAKADLEAATQRSDRQRAPSAKATSMRQRVPPATAQFVPRLIVDADTAVLCSGRQGQYCRTAAKTI